MKKILITIILAVTAFAVLPISSASAKTIAPPKSCVLAIEAAEDGFGVAADFVGAVSDYLNNLRIAAQQAADAGGTVSATSTFLNTQANLIKNLNSQTDLLSSRLSDPADRFALNKAKCRAGK